MRALKRFIRQKVREHKNKPFVKKFKQDLEAEFGQGIELKQGGSRGRDSIFKVSLNGEILGVGRLITQEQAHTQVPAEQPYQRIDMSKRIDYEWECCEAGYQQNLTPKPLWKNDNAILVSHCPGESFQNYFLKNPEKCWDYVLRASQALHAWHQLGRSHMDSNISNIMGDPDCKDAFLIDFEYVAGADVNFAQQKAFDYLRLIESVQKFLPDNIKEQYGAWEKWMIETLDDETRNADLERLMPGIKRTYHDKVLSKAVKNIFKNA